MRITGGLDRGRKLRAPRGLTTRPTAAKVREAIFNILGPPPDGAVLDLFAGTGALGLEALSRGASHVVFVERDARALAALQRNLRELQLQDRAKVINRDARQAVRQLAGTGLRFSWVFIDPPYAAGEVDGILAELKSADLLAGTAVIIVEHDKRHEPPEHAGDIALCDRRYYGDTGLSFYRHTGLCC